MSKALASLFVLLALTGCSEKPSSPPVELTQEPAPVEAYRPTVQEIKKTYARANPGLGPESYECIAEKIYNSPLSADGVKAIIAKEGERKTDYSQADLAWLNSSDKPMSKILADCIPSAIIIG